MPANGAVRQNEQTVRNTLRSWHICKRVPCGPWGEAFVHLAQRLWNRLSSPLGVAALFTVFFLTNWLSMDLYVRTGQLLTVRPHLGIALALCLIIGDRALLPVLAAEFAAVLVARSGVYAQPLPGGVWAAADTLLAILLIHFGVRKILGPNVNFRDWKHLLAFIGVSAIASILTGLPYATTATSSWEKLFGASWMVWTMSTFMACLLITPAVMLALTSPPGFLWRRKHQIASTCLGVLATVVIAGIPSRFPSTGLVQIALMLVALVVDIEIVALALLWTQIVFTIAILDGHAPSALASLSMGQKLLFNVASMTLITTLLLPTAAAISGRRRLLREYREALAREAQANAQLRTSEARYRLVSDNASDVILQSDSDHRILFLSPSSEHVLGYRDQDVLGRDCTQFVLEEDRETFQQAAADLMRDPGAPGIVQYRIRHKDGRIVWIENHLGMLRDAEGGTVGWISCLRDITEKKAQEMELAQLGAELNHLGRVSVIGQMSAAIAHELNQPLTAIVNYANAARRYLESGQGAQAIANARDAILKAADQSLKAGAIIRGLRQFLEHQPRESRPENLNEILRETMTITMLGRVAGTIRIVEQIDSRNIPVHVNRVQIQQVMQNLLLNAVEAMAGQAGGVITLSTGIGHDGHAWLDVADTGPGVTPEQLGNLFQSFKTSKPNGMGMGLSISKAIIQAHGGTITLASNGPGGACFRVRIPLHAESLSIAS